MEVIENVRICCQQKWNQVEPRCAALDLWSLCLQRTVASAHGVAITLNWKKWREIT